MFDGFELFTLERTGDRSSENVPCASALVDDQTISLTAEAEQLSVDFGNEYADRTDVTTSGNGGAFEAGRSTRNVPDGHNLAVEFDVDNAEHREIVEHYCGRLTARPQGDNTLFGREATVGFTVEEERVLGHVVVTRVRIGAVVAAEARVSGQHEAVGVCVAEVGPLCRLHRKQFELGAGQHTDHRRSVEVSPKRLGLAVVHDQR